VVVGGKIYPTRSCDTLSDGGCSCGKTSLSNFLWDVARTPGPVFGPRSNGGHWQAFPQRGGASTGPARRAPSVHRTRAPKEDREQGTQRRHTKNKRIWTSPQHDSIAQPAVGEPSYHRPPPRQTLLPALVALAHISLSLLVKVGGQTAEFADGPGGKMKRCAAGSRRDLANGPSESESESESESSDGLAVAPFAFVERIRRSAPHHFRTAYYGCSASCTTVEEFSSQGYSGYSIFRPAAAVLPWQFGLHRVLVGDAPLDLVESPLGAARLGFTPPAQALPTFQRFPTAQRMPLQHATATILCATLQQAPLQRGSLGSYAEYPCRSTP
jgi:hypothetical protein